MLLAYSQSFPHDNLQFKPQVNINLKLQPSNIWSMCLFQCTVNAIQPRNTGETRSSLALRSGHSPVHLRAPACQVCEPRQRSMRCSCASDMPTHVLKLKTAGKHECTFTLEMRHGPCAEILDFRLLIYPVLFSLGQNDSLKTSKWNVPQLNMLELD